MRNALLTGIFFGVIIFSKASLALGLFLSQYYFTKAGLIPSILFTFVTIILINLFMIALCRLANRIEYEKEIEITTYDQLAKHVLGQWSSAPIKFLIILMNLGCLLSDILLITNFFHTKIEISIASQYAQLIYKLIFILFLITIGLLVLEPENIKFTSLISFILFFFSMLVLYIMVINKGIIEGFKGDPFHYNRRYYINLVSEIVFTMEAIPMLFSVRATLKERRQMPRVIVFKVIICLIIFIFSGCLFLFVY